MVQKFFPLLLFFVIIDCVNEKDYNLNKESKLQTQISDKNYWHSISAINENNLINVVIEIPAGENAKWEVNKETGFLEWESRGDSLRVVDYLPYPANYGFVPGTYLPEYLGGDGDPVDVFVLGPRKSIGEVIPVRVVGLIKMIDNGEQDDKIIAVDPNSWFYSVNSLDDLESNYVGISHILLTWLEHYKGENVTVEIIGIENENEAFSLIESGIEAYNQAFIE